MEQTLARPKAERTDEAEAELLLHVLRSAYSRAKGEPGYTWTGDENIGPWEAVADADRAVKANRTAMRILDDLCLSPEDWSRRSDDPMETLSYRKEGAAAFQKVIEEFESTGRRAAKGEPGWGSFPVAALKAAEDNLPYRKHEAIEAEARSSGRSYDEISAEHRTRRLNWAQGWQWASYKHEHGQDRPAVPPAMSSSQAQDSNDPDLRASIADLNPTQPLETNSRTDLSQPIERSEVMKPNQSQQENYIPGAHASITGTVERKKEFERMTAVTVRSDLPDGFSRYNQVLLFDAAARRAASAIEDGATVRFDARVHENVFEKGGKETYRTDVISRRIDRVDPGAAHEATLTVTGEVRRGFLANDKVTMGSLVSETRDGEPRYHSVKAFDDSVRDALQSVQIGDRLTLTGTIGQNSYEKDGQKVYTTDLVIDRVSEHTPAPRQAPAPLPTQGNDHRQEHRQTNRPH